MRPGLNFAPLRWDDDVDLDAGTLTIRRSQRRRFVGAGQDQADPGDLPPGGAGRPPACSPRGDERFGRLRSSGVPPYGRVRHRDRHRSGCKPLRSALGLPPRKLRGLRWDVDIDLATGVVRRPNGEEAMKISSETVDLLQKRRDEMKRKLRRGQ